ncbi:exported hypothetical protein [Candidatus Sulfotelmatobacter kueseliae]|uniref:Uncharacterized protein n=1 Tax=Candidatus Sulfotelmatobacter kueseliae TaxID=2042962 RepID=A0A2U3LC13_9BACT|nr:exported hypothetical protein [Candidatus Sulfotelmatobacter kueseliae]
MRLRLKRGVCLVSLVVACVLLWSAYAPERWLGRIRRFVRTSGDELSNIPKPQPPKERIEGRTPEGVVDEIWRMATQGQLLTPDGWRIAGGFFTEPRPFPANEKILVVCNEWGPAYEGRSDGNTKEIVVGYWDAGSIDAKLRYTPPPPENTGYVKTAFSYTLVTAPSYLMMYGPDGKTLVEKRPTGSRVWLIKGTQTPPVTTVNTAVRYVLEMREKTTDQATKENASRTLAQLLKFR